MEKQPCEGELFHLILRSRAMSSVEAVIKWGRRGWLNESARKLSERVSMCDWRWREYYGGELA